MNKNIDSIKIDYKKVGELTKCIITITGNIEPKVINEILALVKLDKLTVKK